jgi:signal transduction histidine kinase
LLFLILFIFTFSFLFAHSQIVIKNYNDEFYEFQLDIYEDKTNNLTIEDIQKIDKFQVYQNKVSKGYSDSTFWFRFEIINKSNQDIKYYIQSIEKLAHKLNCYIVSNDKSYIKYHDGISSFIDGKQNLLDDPKFEINLKKNESKIVYLELSSIYPNYTRFQVLNKDSVYEYTLEHDKIYFLYFGTFVALIIYNLFIFFYIKRIHYFYYVLYGTSLLLWQLLLTGFYPFDSFRSITNTYIAGVLISVIICFFVLFSQSILNTKELLPKDDKVLSYIVYLFAFYSFGYIFFIQEFLFLINFTVTFILPYVIYLAFRSYKLGNKTAKFYLFAQIPFVMSATIYSFMSQGHIDYNIATRHAILVGSFIEMLIFSLALAHKLKILEEEKLELSNENLKIANKLNSKLEKEIDKRTKELQIAKEKAEQSSQFKADFLADMTHQIRTPLTNLMMNTEMIKNEYKNDDYLEIFIDQIDASTNMISNSYEDLMYLTSYDTIDYKSIEVSISDIMKQRVKFFNTLSKIYNKPMNINIDDNIIININPTELERVIDNNLSNAIKYAISNKEINIILSKEKNSIKMVFKSYGKPIENTTKVFEKSYRENNAKRGLGLGLNIVKNICEKYKIDYNLYYENEQNIFQYNIKI